MQKHTLCCSVVFLRAMLKKDSKLRAFTSMTVYTSSDLQSRQKSIFCVSIFLRLRLCVLVRENRRNATWEGHILTRNCCVSNGSKKMLSLTHHRKLFSLSYHRNPQRNALSLENVFNISPIPPISVLLFKLNNRGCICCILYVAFTNLYFRGWERALFSMKQVGTYTKNIKVSFVHNDRKRSREKSIRITCYVCEAYTHRIVGCSAEKMLPCH